MPIESYRAARRVRTANLLLQALLFLTLFGGLNYLARLYAWRFDFTRQRLHSLSPETLSYLRELKQPVRIIAALRPKTEDAEAAQIYREVEGLLREYVYATQQNSSGRISVAFLDVYVRRREAEKLGIEQPDTILFISGEHRRSLSVAELYQHLNLVREVFQGEQVVTAAILDVSSPEKKKVYFLTGHGELAPDVMALTGASSLRDELRQRNYEVDVSNLSLAKRVPEDADLILILSPQGPFPPYEQELLRQYLATRAGRVILALAPRVRHGLDDLLYDWGMQIDDNVVIDPDALAETADFIFNYVNTQHPITKTLADYRLPLRVGLARSVRPNPRSPLDDTLKVAVLVLSSETSWVDFGYRQKSPLQLFTPPPADERRRHGVVITSERVTAGTLPFSVPGGRLIVVGSGDVFSNQRLANPGNQALALNAVNWAVNRDTQLNIPPRPIQRFQLSLTRRELGRLRLGLLGVLPGCIALLGLLVYWTRRS